MPEHYQPGILILAAGASRRFNGIKQLAAVGDRLLLSRILDTVTCLPAKNKLCVLGANAGQIRRQIEFKGGIQVQECQDWQEGLAASITFGVRHLEHCSHIFLLLADQPDIEEKQLRLLLEESASYPEKIVCACYQERNGAPAIFPNSFLPVLTALKGDRGAGQFLNQPEQQRHIKPVSLQEAAVDIDTQDELAAWHERHNQGSQRL